jgi:co-chaperonin GroES (HSP10)
VGDENRVIRRRKEGRKVQLVEGRRRRRKEEPKEKCKVRTGGRILFAQYPGYRERQTGRDARKAGAERICRR